MVKHTQTIRQQKPTNCLSVFDHFAGWWFEKNWGKEFDGMLLKINSKQRVNNEDLARN